VNVTLAKFFRLVMSFGNAGEEQRVAGPMGRQPKGLTVGIFARKMPLTTYGKRECGNSPGMGTFITPANEPAADRIRTGSRHFQHHQLRKGVRA